MSLCINCGIATDRCNTIGRRRLEDEVIISLVQEWVAPQSVNENDFICQVCWNHANTVSLDGNRPEESEQVPIGHRRVCIHCGRSLLRRIRCHQLRTGTIQERRIHKVIREWILPRTVGASSVVCHSCWVRANRASRHFQSGPSTSAATSSAVNVPNTQDIPHVEEPPIRQETYSAPRAPTVGTFIVLPDYYRAVETENRCFVEGCRRRERNRITNTMRKQLLKMYNYYVPANNRLCDIHLTCTSWDFLNDISDNIINTFSAHQIKDMFSLKEADCNILDFENIECMEDHIFYHWVGFNKDQFRQILNEVPQFLNLKNGSLILAAYLIKLRTGDSDDRLSTLLQIPKTTLVTQLGKARSLLYDYFVPHHLGLNHINKQQIIERNLLIPNELFGWHNSEVKPIVVLDGTYVYVQKSSNYKYQKKTYSLHKYQNLVKPFLIVCTDGYIIDVWGPYPATTSDAEIIKKEFGNESLLRQYFESGDAFILDRGFRDALPLLNDCGYRTYVPSSLQQGESQLSTLEANKSRTVTICRWIVEVVNGRFKRDFKIFRQDFFNRASKNVMVHFEVAAALINAFHPPIANRSDAQDILQKINQYINVENQLSNYVINNNINRRRAQFQAIDVERHNVSEFPVLTYSELILVSLGTYQIKQARSYYGEHVRENGSFVIEVCREVTGDLQQELATSVSTWMLRGRIKSRHISNRMYYVYILVDSSLSGRDAIIQYYCTCIVGKRTVGCCAHTMSIIWYLGWARHQGSQLPPAQLLDNVLLYYDNPNEDVE
ncbi:uncharacterized protein LOC113500467 [Trichoplusia ni]|uniref:Uncharacterized protein LOC113500467 n=1 Tax=Trichoplusia ni TaxID=7111 RepID=A0A7E5WA55_TRINI|nr:uncharacterized protein LOC113500467 [Trichoplusia ni]